MTDLYHHRHNHITLTHSLTHSLTSALTYSLTAALTRPSRPSLTYLFTHHAGRGRFGRRIGTCWRTPRARSFVSFLINLASRQELYPCESDHHPVKWSSRAQNASDQLVDMRPHCLMCSARASYSCECCRVGLCLDAKGDQISSWKNCYT